MLYYIRERPITQDDMMKLSELPSHSNDCRVADNMPVEMLPMVYYRGDGDTMFVAVQKQYSESVLKQSFVDTATPYQSVATFKLFWFAGSCAWMFV